jgi:hypothetical protein
MCGVLAAEDVEGTGEKFKGFDFGVLAFQQLCNTTVISIGVGTQVAAADEVAALGWGPAGGCLW